MPLLILTSFNSVDVLSHPCPTLSQTLPMVPQAEMFAGLIILEAIVKIISVISTALGVQMQCVRSEQGYENVIPSLEPKGHLPPCVVETVEPGPSSFSAFVRDRVKMVVLWAERELACLDSCGSFRGTGKTYPLDIKPLSHLQSSLCVSHDLPFPPPMK